MKRPAQNILDSFQRPAGWWGLFVLWVVVITLVTCIPGRNLPSSPFVDFDKAVHFIAFLLGAVILFPAVRLSTRWRLFSVGSLTFSVVVLIGILDEYKQLCIPGRQGGDWADITANSLGAAAGVIMLWMIYGYSIGRRKKARRLAAQRD